MIKFQYFLKGVDKDLRILSIFNADDFLVCIEHIGVEVYIEHLRDINSKSCESLGRQLRKRFPKLKPGFEWKKLVVIRI
jgi:hypothetical protein